MPVDDYVCLDCHKPFETVLTLNEHDNENPKCPHCGWAALFLVRVIPPVRRQAPTVLDSS